MAKFKTRCKECFYSKYEAKEEPCNKCNEIQHTSVKCENHFIPSNKDLMKDNS